MLKKKIFVVGAGQMGGGIAQVFAQAKNQVFLYDISDEALNNRIIFIKKILDKDVYKEKITAKEKDEALSRILPTTSLDDVVHCNLVIEAAAERMDVKKKIFKELDNKVLQDCILATNTSSLPITEIAAVTERPDRVIGMHFMNPVPVMSLVEIIRGLATSDATYNSIEELTFEIGKFPVSVKDFPGFVSNRVIQIMINEAIHCVSEGIASIEGIDEIMKRGMNHPMGPLELADFIGLDTVYAILSIMYDGFGDSKFKPSPLLKQYVDAGWLGKKTGKGFYNYK